ncbi:Mitochondrial fission process protein 1 [Bulinus truncatus]|nr:Mitochondrial fission process protein 1 [Bulinus truncatus]
MSDIYRDNVIIRFIGHSFAIAEALKFAEVSEDSLNMLNTVACVYILTHAGYRGFKTRQGNIVMSTMFDTLIFDGLASALIPRIIVHYVCRITAATLREISAVPEPVMTWGPTIMGLTALLLGYERIDWEVSNLLNETVRKLY